MFDGYRLARRFLTRLYVLIHKGETLFDGYRLVP